MERKKVYLDKLDEMPEEELSSAFDKIIKRKEDSETQEENPDKKEVIE